MKILITAGGTGGHIFPSVALIERINKDKNNEILFIGTKTRMESTLIPSMNIKFIGLTINGFSKNIIKDIKNIKKIYTSYKESLKILRDFKPDAVIGFGGYVSFPVLKASKKLGIKTYIHEQNVVPGKTNKILSRYCNKVFTSFSESKKYFNKCNVVFSGNPCSERAHDIKTSDKTKLGFSREKKLIIIVMGSMGSSVVNETIKEFLNTYSSSNKEILFISGKNSGFDNSLKVPSSTKIVEFMDNLPGLMKDADLIISRAGASTIAEILEINIPSILVPSPYVANNHQYYNALNLSKRNLAVLLEQKDLNSSSLIKEINNLLDNKKNYLEIKRNLEKVENTKSSSIIYDTILKDIKE
ncbi:MAG: undecaprenyldiphospho-muramoylpentapeptide beta-N-acetylglucosaminyltransferase [Bacilli bacterium]